MPRFTILILLIASLSSAELALTGTWAGAKAELPAGATVVLAIYDRNGTCCGGPAAALAGLGNLRTALKDRADVRLVAIDVTVGATAEQATAAAAQHHTDGIPLLVDGARATATTLGVEIDMTMTYVLCRADSAREVSHSPSQVKKKLGL
jgi:hypothetical protein